MEKYWLKEQDGFPPNNVEVLTYNSEDGSYEKAVYDSAAEGWFETQEHIQIPNVTHYQLLKPPVLQVDKVFVLRKDYMFLAAGTILEQTSTGDVYFISMDPAMIGLAGIKNYVSLNIVAEVVEGAPAIFEEVTERYLSKY